MACACGYEHTITLSDDGTAYSFGSNNFGALGYDISQNSQRQLDLGDNNNDEDVSLPTPIPNLPKIKVISCGTFFTICVDHEGFIWSFGENNYGQLGTGNKINSNVPKKIHNIPPVFMFFAEEIIH